MENILKLSSTEGFCHPKAQEEFSKYDLRGTISHDSALSVSRSCQKLVIPRSSQPRSGCETCPELSEEALEESAFQTVNRDSYFESSFSFLRVLFRVLCG